MFLRKTKDRREPVPVTMTGVRMGERVLQVGTDTPSVAAAIASRVGLSGTAAIAVADEAAAKRARTAAEESGGLVEVLVGPLDHLQFPDGAFDLVVVHGMGGHLGGTSPGSDAGCLAECGRVLRAGGRVVTLTPGPRQGLGALFRASTPPDTGLDAASALSAAGFKPVRVVGELEGFRFTEGLKT